MRCTILLYTYKKMTANIEQRLGNGSFTYIFLASNTLRLLVLLIKANRIVINRRMVGKMSMNNKINCISVLKHGATCKVNGKQCLCLANHIHILYILQQSLPLPPPVPQYVRPNLLKDTNCNTRCHDKQFVSLMLFPG